MTDPIHAYLLLDTSASMDGAPLEALKQGLTLVCATFIARSKRPVHVCLISYESTAHEIKKLSDVHEFDMPANLVAAGSSGLAGALRLVSTLLPEPDPTLIPTLVYIFTDGEPTDDWEIAITALKPRVQKIFGILCGPAANSDILEPVLDETFRNRELSPDHVFETFRAFN